MITPWRKCHTDRNASASRRQPVHRLHLVSQGGVEHHHDRRLEVSLPLHVRSGKLAFGTPKTEWTFLQTGMGEEGDVVGLEEVALTQGTRIGERKRRSWRREGDRKSGGQ